MYEDKWAIQFLVALKWKGYKITNTVYSASIFQGCMAESLKKKLLEADKSVDLVAGPGEYAWCSLEKV